MTGKKRKSRGKEKVEYKNENAIRGKRGIWNLNEEWGIKNQGNWERKLLALGEQRIANSDLEP